MRAVDNRPVHLNALSCQLRDGDLGDPTLMRSLFDMMATVDICAERSRVS